MMDQISHSKCSLHRWHQLCLLILSKQFHKKVQSALKFTETNASALLKSFTTISSHLWFFYLLLPPPQILHTQQLLLSIWLLHSLMWLSLPQFPLHKLHVKLLFTRATYCKKSSDLCFLLTFTACILLVPEAKGRIHSLLLRSSLHRSLKAALQLLWVQPPNTYMDWFES